ncbi:MAG: hypothetical protein IPG33_09970 [Betaproteobacteria bacterium]|nr:hypothetical protein [Betaproteobacteria bacterium]
MKRPIWYGQAGFQAPSHPYPDIFSAMPSALAVTTGTPLVRLITPEPDRAGRAILGMRVAGSISSQPSCSTWTASDLKCGIVLAADFLKAGDARPQAAELAPRRSGWGAAFGLGGRDVAGRAEAQHFQAGDGFGD